VWITDPYIHGRLQNLRPTAIARSHFHFSQSNLNSFTVLWMVYVFIVNCYRTIKHSMVIYFASSTGRWSSAPCLQVPYTIPFMSFVLANVAYIHGRVIGWPRRQPVFSRYTNNKNYYYNKLHSKSNNHHEHTAKCTISAIQSNQKSMDRINWTRSRKTMDGVLTVIINPLTEQITEEQCVQLATTE